MPRAAEELYDLQADPYGMKNLADDSAFKKQLTRFRVAHQKQVRATPDWSFVPEPISLAAVNMRETKEGREFALAAFEAAQMAALQTADLASDRKILAMLDDANAAVRYWAAIGVRQRLDRMKDSTSELEPLLTDKQQVVQVVAAEVICLLQETPADVKARAIERLLELADLSNSSYLVAVAALDALDRQRELLDSEALTLISELPTKAVGRVRGTDDLVKLKSRFQPTR
jgi:hypothetical protein